MNLSRALVTAAMLISSSIALGAPNVPAGLYAVRKDLAQAVQTHDRKRIVALSDSPLAVEGYGAAPKMTAQQFLANEDKFDGLFGSADAGIVRCIRTDPPQLQGDKKSFGYGSWFIDCNGNEYFFALRSGKWLFVGYQNINE